MREQSNGTETTGSRAEYDRIIEMLGMPQSPTQAIGDALRHIMIRLGPPIDPSAKSFSTDTSKR